VVTDEQAALIMLNLLTAVVMTRYVLGVGEGQWLLMSAGASTVSQLVTALGHRCGFRSISLVRDTTALDLPPGQLGEIQAFLMSELCGSGRIP
jgi:NADPH:quinone reductase-like Zn-dependent oxidoreductase